MFGARCRAPPRQEAGCSNKVQRKIKQTDRGPFVKGSISIRSWQTAVSCSRTCMTGCLRLENGAQIKKAKLSGLGFSPCQNTVCKLRSTATIVLKIASHPPCGTQGCFDQGPELAPARASCDTIQNKSMRSTFSPARRLEVGGQRLFLASGKRWRWCCRQCELIGLWRFMSARPLCRNPSRRVTKVTKLAGNAAGRQGGRFSYVLYASTYCNSWIHSRLTE